ncbi:hypothetical protein M9458_012203 [Cirrhinus mrigala]|uniref:Vegetative cell wall protein gp1-like n=1 Tax=Cirrhinus mrigala TaxID=683832 RepID=A0ABD0R5Z7_CIRMR
MSWAEDALWRLRQDGRELERYVEEFIELSHQVGWHETSLGAVFVLGLDDETIRCELPTCSFPLIELINLILYLNGSDFEVEEVQSPIRSHPPVSSQTQRHAPACPKPRTSTYRVNGSNRQPSPKSPVILQSSTAVLSPMRPASSPRSNPPATAQSPVPRAATPAPARKMAATPAPARKMAATPAPARKMAATPAPARKMAATPESARKMAAKPESPVMIAGMNIMDRAIPLEFTAPIISPDSPEPPLVPSSLPEPPLVPSSLPEPPLVPSSLPEPPLVPSSLPEPPLVPSSLPEPPLVPPSLPESSQVVAVFPESRQVAAAATEPSQATAVVPESSHVTAESSHITATSPESNQVPGAFHKPRQSPEPAPPSARPPEPAPPSARPPEPAPPSARPPEPAPHPALPTAGSTVNFPKKILGGGYPPWPPELFTRPWPPEPPDPPWPPELFTRPWPPEPPDPPWPPELSVRPWPPELPDPPWPPELPDPPWRYAPKYPMSVQHGPPGRPPPHPSVCVTARVAPCERGGVMSRILIVIVCLCCDFTMCSLDSALSSP